MPGVPPINPQLLMALAQKFGGIAPAINAGGWPGGTPPFLAAPRVVLPRTNTRDADAQGRIPPQRPMVIPTGSAAPTAPGTTPSPSSLGQVLSRVPAAAPATLGGQDDFGQPVQAPTPPVGKLGTLPEGAEQIYAPDLTPPGGKVFNKDGTTYVVDKDGTVVRRMEAQPHNPNAPAAGTPASMPQKKGGIWSRLTDPSLAGIALAAGQQMTRARYPGETGIGNAVNAVTAGYNTLAQQRQMQVAREEAARKARLEEREQARKESGTTSENAQRTAQNERWKAMSENEKRKYDFDKDKWIAEKGFKERELGYKGREVTVAEQNSESLKADREARARNDEQRVAALETQVDIAKQELAARIKENATDNERLAAELKVHQGQLDLGWARNQREANKEGNEKFLPFLKEAGDEIYGQERNELQAAYNSGKPYQPPDSAEHDKKVNALAMKRYREAQRMQGKKGFEEPPNPLGPDIIPPPPGPAVRGPAAQPWQGVGPPAPAAAPQQGGPTVLKHPQTGQRIVLDGKTNQWVDAATGRPVSQ